MKFPWKAFWAEFRKTFFGWDITISLVVFFILSYAIMWLTRSTEWCIVIGGGIAAVVEIVFEIIACKGDQERFNVRRLWGAGVGIFIACNVAALTLLKDIY